MKNYIECLYSIKGFSIILLCVLIFLNIMSIVIAVTLNSGLFIVLGLLAGTFFISLSLVPTILTIRDKKKNVQKIINSIENKNSYIECDQHLNINSIWLIDRKLIKGEYNIKIEVFDNLEKTIKIAKKENGELLGKIESFLLYNYIVS